MGSILSQVGQKCYREGEKSERGHRVRGILRADSPVRSVASLCEVRFFLTEKPRLLFLLATTFQEIRSNSPQSLRAPRFPVRPAPNPLRPASLEAS
jgi:hypothetical protein